VATLGTAIVDSGRQVLFSRTIDLVQRLRTARRDPSPPTLAKRQALYRAFSEQHKSFEDASAKREFKLHQMNSHPAEIEINPAIR
jgi:hypothetical protein